MVVQGVRHFLLSMVKINDENDGKGSNYLVHSDEK
jgi:hypothetical protein